MIYLLIAVLSCAVFVLAFKVIIMHKAAAEIESGMKYVLENETNTLLSVTRGDRQMCRLANSLNVQLKLLRRERHKYQSGDLELKQAVTNISHDLRTPLTVICGYLELLEKENMPPDAAGYIEIIKNRAQSLSNLTEELFAYSRISSPDIKVNAEEVSVKSMLEESISSYYPALKSRGVEPVIKMPNSPVMRSLDRALAQRIFENILSNAVKYSDGDLEIELSSGGSVTFKNSAKSIGKTEIGRLFDRFYTIENARNSTGLGLSIAKLLTERLGGTISADYDGGYLTITVNFK